MDANAYGRVQRIPLTYDHNDGDASALDLVLKLNPDWKTDQGRVNIVRLTGGIMNTVRPPTKYSPW